jgi:hypothetical protein
MTIQTTAMTAPRVFFGCDFRNQRVVSITNCRHVISPNKINRMIVALTRINDPFPTPWIAIGSAVNNKLAKMLAIEQIRRSSIPSYRTLIGKATDDYLKGGDQVMDR